MGSSTPRSRLTLLQRDLLDAFFALERRLVLTGGGALAGFYFGHRDTEDIDLFIRPTATNVACVRSALASLWTDPAIEEIVVEDLAGEYPTVRYGPPGEDFVIDLIARLGDAFEFESLVAETMVIEGVRVRVATPQTLYRMKRDTLRPIDQVDAEALRQKFDLGD